MLHGEFCVVDCNHTDCDEFIAGGFLPLVEHQMVIASY